MDPVKNFLASRDRRGLRAPRSKSDILYLGRFAGKDGLCFHCHDLECEHRARVFKDDQGFCADVIDGDGNVVFGLLDRVRESIATVAIVGLAKDNVALKKELRKLTRAKH